MFKCKKGNYSEMRKLLRIKRLNTRMKCLQAEWKWTEDANAKHCFKKAIKTFPRTARAKQHNEKCPSKKENLLQRVHAMSKGGDIEEVTNVAN